jgi:hypothetical protein
MFELMGFAALLKQALGKRISEWYHAKPLSEIDAFKLIPKYLEKAEEHLKRSEFEGASEMFSDTA